MKRILAFMLVFVLTISCFVGCGKDDNKNNDAQANSNGSVTGNEVKGVLTLSDISETMSKMANGQEIDIKLTFAVKPVFDEYYTEENFLEDYAGLVVKKEDGLFEIPLSVTGIAAEKKANLTIKLADKNVTDFIVAEEKMFINAKAIFDFVFSLMPEEAGLEFAWPCQNTYVDIKALIEYVQELNSQMPDTEDNYTNDFSNSVVFSELAVDSEEDWSDDEYFVEEPTISNSVIGGLDAETLGEIKAVIEVISTAIPETTLKLIGTQIVTALKSNNALTVDADKISIKLDAKNLKAVVLAFSDLIRTHGADVIDYIMQAIINTDKLDEDMKASMTEGYDKEKVKQDLENELKSDEIGKEIDEFIPEMKDTHLYVDLESKDNSVNIAVDLLLDGLAGDSQQSEDDMYLDDSSDMEQVRINFAYSCKAKDGVTVTAPDNVLTEAEINTLVLLLSNFF